MGILGEMSVTSVLVEGGALVMGSILQHGLADKIYIFKAPKIFGGDDGVPMASGKGPVRMEECLVLKDLRIRRYGTDVLMIGYPDYGKVRPVAKGQRFD
jgi:diaminohydroxyphosphoribosylaminopyrimidine deaminase/5-amino-6-(5-phosphoribosylamino)uracil reductase